MFIEACTVKLDNMNKDNGKIMPDWLWEKLKDINRYQRYQKLFTDIKKYQRYQ